MSGQKLVDRLINDIEKSIVAKKVATSRTILRESVLNSNPKSDFTIEEELISMTCNITLPYSLSDLMQFINFKESLLKYKSGDKVDLNDFVVNAAANRNSIADIFQKIKDNKDFVLLDSEEHKTLFSVLEDKLEDIHSEVEVVERCYNKLISEKKS